MSNIRTVAKAVATTTTRALNDANAKKCENEVINLINHYIVKKRKMDIILTDITNETHHSLVTAICSIIPPQAFITKVIKRAGRKYNYDLELEYVSDDITQSLCLEIKQGKGLRNIEKTPQILSVAEKDDTFQPIGGCLYAQFFYDKYLREYNSKLDTPFHGELPTRDDYVKWVYGSNYKKHPWFLHAKQYSTNANQIVAQSIGEYLETHLSSFNAMAIIERLQTTQLHKHFLINDTTTGKWTVDRFTHRDLQHYPDPDEVGTAFGAVGDSSETYLPRISLYEGSGKTKYGYKNTFMITLPYSTIKCLLRWKNHNGVLYPAYQISVIRQRLEEHSPVPS